MNFRELSAGSGLIIGKMIYDVDSKAPLGIAQLQSRHPDGGHWLHLKVNEPREIIIIHRDHVLIEEPPNPPVGWQIKGSPESRARRRRGEEAGASWKDRPELADGGLWDSDDPRVFPSKEAAEQTNRVVYRPVGTFVHRDDAGQEIEFTPAGGPLGRTTVGGMPQMAGDLAYVKTVLANGSSTTRSVGRTIGQLDDVIHRSNVSVKGTYDELGRMIGVVISAINDINEQRSAIIAATTGHQVQAPVTALNQLDQAKAKLEELMRKIIVIRARLEEAIKQLNAAEGLAGEFNTLTTIAADGIDRYRTSF